MAIPLTIKWDNSATGDNNSDIASVTVDLSAIGGSSATVLTDDGTGQYSVTVQVSYTATDSISFSPILTVTDNNGNQTTLSLNSISVTGVPNVFVIPVSTAVEPLAESFESITVLSSFGSFDYDVDRSGLQLFSGGSGLQFDQEFLSQDALNIISSIFNDNAEVGTEVADPADESGINSSNVFDISPLSDQEQKFILDLLETTDEDDDQEEDDVSFLTDEVALRQTAQIHKEPAVTQKNLDERQSLSDTLMGEFDCLKKS